MTTWRNRMIHKLEWHRKAPTNAAWVQARSDDLLPVPYFHNVSTLPHELSALVLFSQRNQRALLKLLFDSAAQTLSEFGRRHAVDRRRQLRRKPWVVYSKPPLAGPRKLLDYLGRYTHRVAISNHRLISCQDGQVCFQYRDLRVPAAARSPGCRLKCSSAAS